MYIKNNIFWDWVFMWILSDLARKLQQLLSKNHAKGKRSGMVVVYDNDVKHILVVKSEIMHQNVYVSWRRNGWTIILAYILIYWKKASKLIRDEID